MNIYETITAVMNEIGAIAKNDKNTQQGFKYRGIDAVMNALAPALQKYKLFVVPEVLEQTREERTTVKDDYNGKQKTSTLMFSICKIRYTFYAEDGSSISAVVVGEGMDSGDKATNKAMSVAFKYACFQVFCIPTEEMVDPDGESHEVQAKPQGKKDEKPTELSLNDVITPVQVAALISRCEKDGVPASIICEWYKVKDINSLTQKAYIQLNNNWEQAVQKAADKKATA